MKSSILGYLATILLLVASWYALAFAMANWWAGSSPLSANPHRAEMHGNLFAAAALLLFVSAVIVAVVTWKRRRVAQEK